MTELSPLSRLKLGTEPSLQLAAAYERLERAIDQRLAELERLGVRPGESAATREIDEISASRVEAALASSRSNEKHYLGSIAEQKRRVDLAAAAAKRQADAAEALRAQAARHAAEERTRQRQQEADARYAAERAAAQRFAQEHQKKLRHYKIMRRLGLGSFLALTGLYFYLFRG